jgi:predicted AlkP superfamily phosphohydrolase/phosphomutase
LLAIFQFDSAALPLVRRMLDEGALPTLASLKARGTWETIDAGVTFLQSSTYPTLCTGVDVRDHGLYSAFPWSASDQRARFVQTFPRPRTIWERLTERGRRSLVVDPYLSWPPRDMSGVFLSGMHFEDRMVMQGRSVPRGERRTLERRHGASPRLDDVYGTRDAESLLAWRDHLIGGPGRTASAVIDLLEREEFELLWLNFSVAHKAGHHLWDPASVVEEQLSSDTERSLRDGLAEVYWAIDAAMGRVLQSLPDDADVIVFSPTGMGPNTSRGDLLPAMLAAVLSGKPRQSQSARSGLRAPVWSLRSSIPASWRSWIARALPDQLVADLTTRLYLRADWSRTPAMAVPGENKGYIRLNVKGREREGIVDAESAEAVTQSIVDGLMTFRDPDGSPTIVRVARTAELANGQAYSDRLPDLVVFWGETAAGGIQRVTSEQLGDVWRNGVGSGRSGNHTDDAWAILAPARSTRRTLERPMGITDIGATACSLFNADMTGLSGTSLLDAA